MNMPTLFLRKFLLLAGVFFAMENPALSLTFNQQPISASAPNVLLILDNSNSMDEDLTGAPAACDSSGYCGSASDYSKSQIARTVAKNIITDFMGRINLGLMAYRQNENPHHVYNFLCDVSYDSANYDPTFSGDPASTTKKYRMENPLHSGEYIYYNVAVPYYNNTSTWFKYYNPSLGYSTDIFYCYDHTGTAHAFNNSEGPDDGDNNHSESGEGPWETYDCYTDKSGASDALSGYVNWRDSVTFYTNDSTLSRGVRDCGTRMVGYYVGPTWFAGESPGRGYLHTDIAFLDSTQATKLNTKLDRSQFISAGTYNNPNFPLDNTGLTPIEGTLLTANDYFLGALTSTHEGGSNSSPPTPPNACGKNFVVLITDGLPSVNQSGTYGYQSNSSTLVSEAAAAAATLKTNSVETYVVGFSLPYGVSASALDPIASSGGTSTAYSATDSLVLDSIFETVFSDIMLKSTPAAAVASNSTQLKIDGRIYQGKFSSSDWSGQLLSYKLSSTGALTATAEWDGATYINATAAASRVVITMGSSDGVPFTWANLTTSQQTALDTHSSGTDDNCGSERVTFLRGGTGTTCTFRTRTSKLGDIVNASPWHVGKPSAGYSDVDHSGYSAFRTAQAARTPVVYVGANDGMLHAFDASLDTSSDATGTTTANSGKELLAYVPSAVYGNLSRLGDSTYTSNHRYLVDGSPMVGDVDISTDATPNWRSVLVAGLGAGGIGYYALDVTDPASFSEANAASIVLWEFDSGDDADMGYAFNLPPTHLSTKAPKQIVKMKNGEWAVILGNGYTDDSTGLGNPSGKAVLYILFINKGIDGTWGTSDYVKIVADTSGSNGLATPVPFDSDGDGVVDVVYAGDLKGQLWKFDVSHADTAQWGVAFSGSPLFTATDSGGTAQPITTPPEVTVHEDGGRMILFGTGKYLEATDTSSTSTQSFYGVRDNGSALGTRTAAGLASITVTETSLGGKTYRDVPSVTAQTNGWVLNLPTSGERATGIPKLVNGVVFFNTFIPSTGSCTENGSGWLMALNYKTGTNPAFPIFDTDNSGSIDGADTIVGGYKVGAALGGTNLLMGSGSATTGAGVSYLTSGALSTTLLSFGSTAKGRVSWREIVR